jgi:hypothetical protein
MSSAPQFRHLKETGPLFLQEGQIISAPSFLDGSLGSSPRALPSLFVI